MKHSQIFVRFCVFFPVQSVFFKNCFLFKTAYFKKIIKKSAALISSLFQSIEYLIFYNFILSTLYFLTSFYEDHNAIIHNIAKKSHDIFLQEQALVHGKIYGVNRKTHVAKKYTILHKKMSDQV